MRYIIANGLYVTPPIDRIDYVTFIESDSIEISIEHTERRILVKCPSGTNSADLVTPYMKLFRNQEIEFNKFPINLELTLNGIRFINIGKYTELHFKQFILSNIDQSTIEYNESDHSIYFVISDQDIPYYSEIGNYLDKINSLGLIYCELSDESKFRLSNIYEVDLVRPYIQEYNTYDTYPANITNEIFINEADIISSWVLTMMKYYPDIDFFNNDDLMDLEKHEHIKYTAQLMPNISQYNGIHVYDDPVMGRWWKGSIQIQLEYIIDDLPTMLTRKDHYRMGKFFNEVHYVEIEKELTGRYNEDGNPSKYTFYNGIFWDRDNVGDGYQQKPSTTNNDISQFSFTFHCTIFCTLIEKLDTPVPIKYPSYIMDIIKRVSQSNIN